VADFGPSYYKNSLSGAVEIAPSGAVWTLHKEFGEPGSTVFVRFSGPNGSTVDIDPFPYYQGRFNEATAADMAVVSGGDAWAVGVSNLDENWSSYHPLISHWTGADWRHQTTSFSLLNNTALNGVSAVSATDIWAVGNHLVVRYSC